MKAGKPRHSRISATEALWRFLAVFFMVFFLVSSFLYIVDFVPEKPEADTTHGTEATKAFAELVDVNAIAQNPIEDVASEVTHAAPAPLASATYQAVAQAITVYAGEVPLRIVAKDVGVDTLVSNPTSSDIASLDNALLKGAVRYPLSATLADSADMLLFGHQSYLPVVHNKAFKAFNDLQKLKEGAEITVYSDSAVYTYRVRSVELVNSDDGKVALNQETRGLVLVTCNSLGAKEDRYIISADFTSRTPIT